MIGSPSATMIAATIGTFSSYKGIDREPIYGFPRQASLIKQLLAQLLPTEGWDESPITMLTTPLAEQPNNLLTVGATTQDLQAAFGNGVVAIQTATLAELAESARIVTVQNKLPAALFLRIQQTLMSQIREQEKRSLREILGAEYATWKNQYADLGFKNKASFEGMAQIPLNVLAMAVCHSQAVHFFVEQQVIGAKAYNKLRNATLENAIPCVLLSTPGMNFAYGSEKEHEYLDNGMAREMISHMWQAVLTSAVNQGCQDLVLSAIGLGAFLPSDWPAHKNAELAKHYYDTLLEQLAKPEFTGRFTSVHINPVFPFAKEALLNAKQRSCSSMAGRVYLFEGDVKFLAIELAKNGIKAGLLNPSDPDVMWGIYDVGEYYKEGHYVGEEDLAATSTAPLGSAGICDAYVNAAKISSVLNHEAVFAAMPVASTSTSSTATTSALQFTNTRTTTVPTNSIMLYSAQRSADEIEASQYRLGIKFTTAAAKNAFQTGFMLEAANQGLDATKLLSVVDTYNNRVYVEPSKGPGTMGVYCSANNELAINLGNRGLRSYFLGKIGINNEQVTLPTGGEEGDDAIYFKPSILPVLPDPNRNTYLVCTPEDESEVLSVTSSAKKIKLTHPKQ